MPHFRPLPPMSSAPGPFFLDEVRAVLADVLAPAHFLVRPPLALVMEQAAAEEQPWEVFRGRLLDPAHTRLRRSFAAWNLFLIEDGRRAAEPVLAFKLDA